MKICVDLRPLSGNVHTGVGEYTKNLLRHMMALSVNSGIEFKLFFNSRSVSPDKDFFEELKGINAYAKTYAFNYPNKIFSAATRLLNLPKIDKMVGGADVVFSPHFIFAPASQGCKKIITFHDLSFERYPEFFDIRRKIWHFSNNPRKTAMEADKIIAVSESTAYDLCDLYGIDSRKISVIYSGTKDNFFNEPAREEIWNARARYNIPEKFVLSLSTIEPRKNILGIIKAFEELKKTEVGKNKKLVLGGSPGWLFKKDFRAMEKSKFARDIFYIGFVRDEDKSALYAMAELFVYPSIYEGFGFPPLEAMACGTPVVTSAYSSLPEVVGDAALMVNPFNVSDLAWAMEEMLKDEELRNIFIKRGREQAAKFSWDKCARETLEVLCYD